MFKLDLIIIWQSEIHRCFVDIRIGEYFNSPPIDLNFPHQFEFEFPPQLFELVAKCFIIQIHYSNTLFTFIQAKQKTSKTIFFSLFIVTVICIYHHSFITPTTHASVTRILFMLSNIHIIRSFIYCEVYWRLFLFCLCCCMCVNRQSCKWINRCIKNSFRWDKN